MARRAALALLTLASLVMVAALMAPHPAAGLVFASASLLCPPTLVALGASRHGRLGSLGVPLLLFALFLQLLLGALIVLSGRPVGCRLWAGLPPAGAVLVYGLGLLPLAIVSLGFALHAPRFGPTEEDLQRLRELSRRDGEHGGGEGPA